MDTDIHYREEVHVKTGRFGVMQSETKEKKIAWKTKSRGRQGQIFFLELSRDSRMLTIP